LYAPYSKSLWVVVGLVSLATAAHQGWSANLFTTASDMFPRAAVGSVVGIGGTAGAVGGVLVQIATGYIVQSVYPYLLAHGYRLTNPYLPVFMYCGCGYLVALAIVHSLSPKLAAAELD
jgi:ACS family hexuronate transporter-like MFS transporter